MCNCDCELTKEAKRQQTREETALEIGRDLMEQGLIPTLIRLVGAANASRILAGICGCPCDACTEYCEQGALTPTGCTCAVSATEVCPYCARVQAELLTKLVDAMNPAPDDDDCTGCGDLRDEVVDSDAYPCCQNPDACCGCSCPPDRGVEGEPRPVAADCGVHGDDGCIANGLTKAPCPEHGSIPCDDGPLCPPPPSPFAKGGFIPSGVGATEDSPALLSIGGVKCGHCDWELKGSDPNQVTAMFQALADHMRETHTTEEETRGSRIADAARAWIRRVLRH